MGNQFLWKDPDGVNRWHDHRQPRKSFKNESSKCGTNAWSTGLVSDACGVHPEQVKEFQRDAQSHGFTGVEFTKGGECVFTSRRERARYLRHRGLHDRSGGYGD